MFRLLCTLFVCISCKGMAFWPPDLIPHPIPPWEWDGEEEPDLIDQIAEKK